MLNVLAKRISRIGNALRFLTPEEIDDKFLDEKNLFKRDVITAALNLDLFEENLVSTSLITRELEKIAFLTYAGGGVAAKCSAGYIPNLVHLLEGRNARNDLKVAIFRLVSVIALNNADNQAICFEEGMFTLTGDVIMSSSDTVRMWAIYCLYCMAYDNIPYLQILKQQREVCMAIKEAAKGGWCGFAHNYANLLLKVAGIEKVRLMVKKAAPYKYTPFRNDYKSGSFSAFSNAMSEQNDAAQQQ